MKAMSELFNLPLAVVPACRDPHWGTSIVEADDPVVWTIDRVNPRTTGGFSPKLLVSAQERAEAIVAAVNERDEMRAEVERLKTAIADLRQAFDDPVVVERIAAWSHKSWAGWYRWMAQKWDQIHQGTGESFQERWKRQSETPYVKLSDSEQNSDRAEAKEVLNVLYEILPWPRFESKKGEDCEGHSIARADTGYGESSDSSGTKQ